MNCLRARKMVILLFICRVAKQQWKQISNDTRIHTLFSIRMSNSVSVRHSVNLIYQRRQPNGALLRHAEVRQIFFIRTQSP